MNLVRAFFSQKSGDFSLNFEKGQGRHPPFPPLVTRLCILFILQGRFSTLAVTLINFFEKVIYVSLTECISALKIIWSCWYFIIKLTSRVTFSNENNVLWIILWTASFSKFFRLRKYQKRRPQFRPYQVASAALLCGNGKTESVYYLTPFLHFWYWIFLLIV